MTPTTESVESVEQLAERIVSRYVGGAHLQGCTKEAARDIREWLRSRGFDPDKAPVQPPPTDAHRERVRGALAELRAEGLWMWKVGCTQDFECVIEHRSPHSDDTDEWRTLLCEELTRLGISEQCDWRTAHDAIARANGCETIAELEAKTTFFPPEPSGRTISAEEASLEMEQNKTPTPPSPQPEVVVAERDHAQRLIDAMWDKHHINDWGDPAGCYDIIKQHIDEAIADHMATERAEHERVKEDAVQFSKACAMEKRRRIYYQDIVYAVCNHLDRIFGGKTRCGTIDDPSTEVQALMSSLHKGTRVLELETKLAEKTTQLAATEAKLREAEVANRRELELSGRGFVELGVCIRTMQDSAEVLKRMADAAERKFSTHPQPTNAE